MGMDWLFKEFIRRINKEVMVMVDEFFYWMFHSLDGLGIFFGTIIFVIIICIEVYGKYLRWKEEKGSK